jgi:peptidyl-prolyl cis-trans isomerase C
MNMRTYLYIALVALVFAAPVFAQQITPTSLSTSHIVARVNGVPLFQKELDAQMQALFPYYSVHGGQVPASAQPEIRQKAMDRLLLDELLFQEARRRGLRATPPEVNARIRDARRKTQSKAEFDRAVAEAYGTMSNFRTRAARALMIEKLWTSQVTRPARPTDSDLLKFYRQNKKKFERPEAVRLQTISFLFAENATPAQQDQARKKAEAVLAKAQTTRPSTSSALSPRDLPRTTGA